MFAICEYFEFIYVSSKDNGPGIAEEFRASIFEKFTQADSSDTRMKGGTCLGLGITKAIVEQHKGSIGFDTETGKGTTFYIDLPVLPDKSTAAPSAESGGVQQRILICEDEPGIATILQHMLRSEGYMTDTARTAAQAKQMLAEGNYQAMTLDLGLPDQNGLELLQELRQQPETRDLPVIVVSATAGESQKELNASAIGVIDWIEKPIDSPLFMETVGNILKHAASPRSRILHVEDDESNLEIFAALVGDMAEIVSAKTLAEARRLIEKETFDLVTLDLTLSDGDGEDLLPLLNRSDQPSIPVVIFSARDSSDEAAGSVHAALVKSQTSNEELLKVIGSAIKSDQVTE